MNVTGLSGNSQRVAGPINAGGYTTAPPPQPVGPYDAAVGDLDAALNQLDAEVVTLAQQLAPVLVDRSEGLAGCDKEPTAPTPLLRMLQERRGRVERLTYAMRVLRESVAL